MYWLDELGLLWQGPCKGGEGFRYKMLEGADAAGRLVWCWRLWDRPAEFEQVSNEKAEAIMRMYSADGVKHG